MDFSEEVRNELKKILSTTTPIDAYKVAKIETKEPKTAPLYLVNREVFKEVLYLEQRVRGYFEEYHKKVPKDTFREFGKIIDILPAYRYSIGSKHHYKNISDRDKIFKELGSTIRSYQNKEKKRFKEMSKAQQWDSEYIAKAYRELENSLQEQEEQVRELEKNFEAYDVVITNYEAYEIYPNIYYTTTDGKKKQSILRQEVPNILLYEEDKERAKSRSDKKMERVVKTYDKLCNIIYFKKKKGD